MTVYGNGFLAYHLEVRVAEGQASAIEAQVKAWQAEFRRHGTWPGFPDSLVEHLRALPRVESVVCEGPQSAVLIPLRMVRGLTGQPATLSTVLGTGPISQAVETQLAAWGIDIEVTKRLPDADMPLEFSFREPGGQSASLRLYPASRARYRAAITPPHVPPDHLVLNRFNQGLRDLAEQMAGRGGLVSFRPRELGRHDRLEDYLTLLPLTRQLVLSSRHGVIQQFARHANLTVPRGWPSNAAALAGQPARQLATWLLGQLPAEAILVFNHHPSGTSVFYRDTGDPVTVPAPAGYDAASRAARLQGALLGGALALENAQQAGRDAATWPEECRRLVEVAFNGTNVRPWRYPDRSPEALEN